MEEKDAQPTERTAALNRFKNLGELYKEWSEAGVKASRATTHRLEADIFSGIPQVTGIPRDGKQNRYESRDWDGRGKNLIGSGRDRE